jgi:hypothetical protein
MVAVLDCSKESYPSQWAAERALQAVQESAGHAVEGLRGVLRVRPQSLAPDLEVEEAIAELGQQGNCLPAVWDRDRWTRRSDADAAGRSWT